MILTLNLEKSQIILSENFLVLFFFTLILTWLLNFCLKVGINYKHLYFLSPTNVNPNLGIHY